MRTSILFSLVAFTASAVNAHAIFQRIKVNGVDQGQLVGVRAPAVDNPVKDVTSPDIACNTGLKAPVSTAVVTVPAGAIVSAWYQHVLGGPQMAGDKDNPIAASHKGPLMVYLAKVDNAGTASWTGLEWFKIAEEGLDITTGKWGVDTMIAGNGWWSFTMPSCVAAGQYLMRVELIALHSAYASGGAQFYFSCSNVKITGSGTTIGNDTAKFPGTYAANDPGILLNIYNGTLPNNDLKPYAIPGPKPMQC
ncbi:glycoside hydrolase [Mollisia scopiformis]|uniref:AA9 family lytic polysaccharide monooxygenase n=1 Tax=Mollisia scopiformis TaxID=149040 RepID=A0A194XVG0_MOLSC|nr:glycoside hydrolase [Mollisia scopiformis]KUJ24121.1 glycoside hydrolase [Mollisia scopiformis]